MNILTDEEILAINQDNSVTSYRAYARAIEAAVLSKLRDQQPVAWRCTNWSHDDNDYAYRDYDDRPVNVNGDPTGEPLYAHPLPPSEVVRDAARYKELIYAVQKKFPDETRHETALRYIRRMEEPSDTCCASDAAMEKSK